MQRIELILCSICYESRWLLERYHDRFISSVNLTAVLYFISFLFFILKNVYYQFKIFKKVVCNRKNEMLFIIFVSIHQYLGKKSFHMHAHTCWLVNRRCAYAYACIAQLFFSFQFGWVQSFHVHRLINDAHHHHVRAFSSSSSSFSLPSDKYGCPSI